MRWTLALMIVCFSLAARAQQSFTLTVAPDEAQTMLNKIGELPWKDINPLMQKLIGQINQQAQAAKQPPAPDKGTDK